MLNFFLWMSCLREVFEKEELFENTPNSTILEGRDFISSKDEYLSFIFNSERPAFDFVKKY